MQIAVDDAVAMIGAVPDADDEIAAILADFAGEAPFLVIGPLINEHVVALQGSDAMVVDGGVERQPLEFSPLLRLGIAAIEEALAVVGPGNAGELDPLELVAQILAGANIEDVPGVPVGTPLGFGSRPNTSLPG